MKELIEKAGVLIEALPYIRNFYNKTFVIKYGGAAQNKEELKDTFAQDVVLLNYIGINTVIVHGGGPKITSMMEKMGKKPEFIHGQRFTDKETADIVEMVLGLINKEIVTLINQHGGKAIGLSGKDAGLIRARKKVLNKENNIEGEEIIDIGFVGEIESVDPSIIFTLDEKDFIPVIAPVSVGNDGNTLNINADFVASFIAGALKAEKLIVMTDVSGIKDENNHILSTVKKTDLKQYISEDVITGGMLPKVKACVDALESGVKKIHIIDGRIPHCLLLEIFTQKGIGTEIVH